MVRPLDGANESIANDEHDTPRYGDHTECHRIGEPQSAGSHLHKVALYCFSKVSRVSIRLARPVRASTEGAPNAGSAPAIDRGVTATANALDRHFTTGMCSSRACLAQSSDNDQAGKSPQAQRLSPYLWAENGYSIWASASS